MTQPVPKFDATLLPPGEAALAYLAHHAPLWYGAQRGTPGIDYAWQQPSIAAVEAAGDVFVCQYFSRDPAKNLTPARAAQLQAAKIKIVVVWEYTANAARGGKTQGQRDASDAQVQAEACGIPHIPIYGAVDYDSPPGDQGAINAYFDGFADVLGDDRGRNGYGGFWPLSRAKAAGHLKRLWGTPAWSGDNWATSGLIPDIMQGAITHVGGVECDLDAALSSDYGQWPRPAVPVRTWQEWRTQGRSSLADVARVTTMDPATILRTTVQHYGPFDPAVSGWVNALAEGKAKYTDKIPAGGRLWVLR
jgi:hypothetical protein